MSFSSAEFIIGFVPLSLIVYYIIPRRFTLVGNSWLTIVSLLFYSMCEPLYFLLLVISIVFNWIMGLAIQKSIEHKQKGKRCKPMYAAVIFNVVLLVVFKLIGASSGALNAIVTDDSVAKWFILPAGLSFYTFNAISYIIDIGRKKAEAAKNPLDTALYLAFFVKVTSGPLVQYAEFSKQIKNHRASLDNFSQGLWKFVIGLGKKVLLANNLSLLSAQAFDGKISENTAAFAWLGALAYFLEVYLDFAGYSDMAIGLGRMFGFELPDNFNYPYTAKSVAEYWRRWHITLGAWFKSYVFYPVSVSKGCLSINKKCRRKFGNATGRLAAIALPLFAVWTLTGLWHNANPRYLVWGLINGVFIIWETARKPFKNKRAENIFGHFYTVALAFFTKILVRAPSFSAFALYIKAMLGLCAGAADGTALLWLRETWIVLAVSVLLCFPIAGKLRQAVEKRDSRVLTAVFNLGCAICIVAVFVLSVIAINKEGESPFIYGNF